MLFSDPTFLLLFLPVACLLFYTISRYLGSSAGLAVIFFVSLIFYAPWGLFVSLLLISSITVNFFVALLLVSMSDDRQRTRAAAHGVGQAYNFGALLIFKYHILRYFLAQTPAGFAASLPMIAIPAGISFYTFHQAAFLADAYNREAGAIAYLGNVRSAMGRLRAYVRYAAFVAFFPQLVIGPIVYLHEFQCQVDSSKFGRPRMLDFSVGLTLMAIGLFKKVVIADSLNVSVDEVFRAAQAGDPLMPITAWVGVLSFYAQLYFDFSGYSDMALGLGRLFGIRYPINFDAPLKAVGIIDFYRRWHMTLTRVIARFMFTPMSLWGTRAAMNMRLARTPSRALALWLPLLLNFEVIALWHGAKSTFVVFGLVHGSWYVLETVVRDSKAWKAWRARTSDRLRASLGRAIFLVPMCLTFALFRCESLGGASHLLAQLAGASLGSDNDVRLSVGKIWAASYLLPSLAAIYVLPNSVQFLARYRPGIHTYKNPPYGPFKAIHWRPTWAWSLVTAGMLLFALYYTGRQSPFLYQGF